MPEREMPNIPVYRGKDRDLGNILDKVREAVDHLINTDFITEKDIYCKDLITASDSIYMGEKSPKCKMEIKDGELVFKGEKVKDRKKDEKTEKEIKGLKDEIVALKGEILSINERMDNNGS